MKVPVLQKIVPLRPLFVERRLSEAGELEVKKGHRVSPFDVVGTARVNRGAKKIVFGKGWRVLPKEGQTVEKGAALAQKTLWGVFKNRARAPFGGQILKIDESGGFVLLSFPKEIERLAAGVDGEVVDLVEGRAVLIKTEAVRVRGVFGRGGDRGGEIAVVCGQGDILDASALSSLHSGKIVVGGSLATPEALKKAEVLGVAAVVCGGVRRAALFSPLGLSLLVTEGFGRAAMCEPVFGFLKKREGRYGLLVAERRELIVPDGDDDGLPKARRPEVYPSFAKVAVGDTAQIFSWPNFGKIGRVVEVSGGERRLESGLKAQVVVVEAGGERITVPGRNVGVVR